MALDRIDRTSLSLAVAGHILLFAALSVHVFAKTPRSFDNPPMEVDLIAETALTSAAPELSALPPAARIAAEEGPVEDERVAEADPAPSVPEPTPAAKAPTPAPRPSPKATPKPAPPAKSDSKPAARPKADRSARPTGNLKGLLDGVGKEDSAAKSNAAPARSVGEIRRSIDVAIDGEILPYWRKNAPSGADIDELVTVLELRLTRDGRLASTPRLLRQTGRTPSNEPQQALHVERAIKSVVQAAPFDLPSEYYDQWRVWEFTFRTRTR